VCMVTPVWYDRTVRERVARACSRLGLRVQSDTRNMLDSHNHMMVSRSSNLMHAASHVYNSVVCVR